MQLEKGGKLDQEKILPLTERALLEIGEKLKSKKGIAKIKWMDKIGNNRRRNNLSINLLFK